MVLVRLWEQKASSLTSEKPFQVRTSLKASLNSPPGAIPSCSVMWAETFRSSICINPDMTPFWWKREENINKQKKSTSCADFSEECTVHSQEKNINHLSEEAAVKLPFWANSLIKTALTSVCTSCEVPFHFNVWPKYSPFQQICMAVLRKERRAARLTSVYIYSTCLKKVSE